jgi:selenocysteine lyase/cysteine desulfurase
MRADRLLAILLLPAPHKNKPELFGPGPLLVAARPLPLSSTDGSLRRVGALTYLADIGLEAIGAHEAALTARFLDGIALLPHVRLHGPQEATDRTPTFAVTVEGWTPAAVADALGARGVNVWAGHYYAVEPMRALGLLDAGGAVRIGFVHYHDVDDVDRVVEALATLAGQAPA